MKIRHFKINLMLMAIAFAVATTAESAPGMYRYRNAEGVLVVDFSIPPRFVAGGYDVISPSGRIIRTVPPLGQRLTNEEIQKRQAQKKEDAYILSSYSAVEDIERARKRKLLLIEKEIAILEANLEDFGHRRDRMRKKAASYQASGQQAPENITGILSNLDLHEENTRKLLDERHAQIVSINKQFDRYVQRLSILRPQASTKGETDRDALTAETGSVQ